MVPASQKPSPPRRPTVKFRDMKATIWGKSQGPATSQPGSTAGKSPGTSAGTGSQSESLEHFEPDLDDEEWMVEESDSETGDGSEEDNEDYLDAEQEEFVGQGEPAGETGVQDF